MADTIANDVRVLREALAARPTPGPWQVITDEHPHYLGGRHIERRIGTTWHDPQIKGPTAVVNQSLGIGAEKGDKGITFVSIERQDADYIAKANPDRITRVLAELERLQADAVRYRWLREHFAWHRASAPDDEGEAQAFASVGFAHRTDLSCAAMLDHAIDKARSAAVENGPNQGREIGHPDTQDTTRNEGEQA